MIDEPLRYSDYLVGMIARGEAAAARLRGVAEERRAEAVPAARRAAAMASARLDASPLTDETARAVDARLAAGKPPVEPPLGLTEAPEEAQTAGSWASVLKIDRMPTQEVAALEYANLLTAADGEEDLAAEVFVQPLSTLVRLHTVITNGLTAPEVAGRPRRTEQSVHDGAQGQVLYHTPSPAAIPGLLEDLSSWLGRRAARLPSLVVAGVVHQALLSWQPFEGANGRVARAFARVVLHAREVDSQGLIVFERTLGEDPLGYHREVAATRRRGSLVAWLERWTEAFHGAALEAIAPSAVPARAEASAPVSSVIDALAPGAEITLSQVLERGGVDREQALRALERLQCAGVMRPVPGTQGLRWRRNAHHASA